MTKGLSLRLYIAGDSLTSRLIVENVREACAEYQDGSIQLRVFDITKDPQTAIRDQIIAIPTIKFSSEPGRVFVGNMTSPENVIRLINSIKK